MSAELTYRKASVDDYPAMVTFYNTMYGAHRAVDDLVWMLDDNPAGAGIAFIAIDGTKIVGMRSLVPYLLRRGEEIIPSYKTEDSLVAPTHRNRGIFRKINELLYAYDPATLKWGLSNQIEVLRKLGLHGKHQLTSAVCIDGSLSAWRAAQIPLLSGKGLYLLYLSARKMGKKPLSHFDPHFVTEVEGLTLFFDEWSAEYPERIFPHYSHSYHRWRLDDNPHVQDHYVFGSYVDDTLAIVSFVAITDQKANWLATYSLPVASDADRVSHIQHGIHHLKQAGHPYVETWLFDHNMAVNDHRRCMISAGFSTLRKGLFIHQNEHQVDTAKVYFSALFGIK